MSAGELLFVRLQFDPQRTGSNRMLLDRPHPALPVLHQLPEVHPLLFRQQLSALRPIAGDAASMEAVSMDTASMEAASMEGHSPPYNLSQVMPMKMQICLSTAACDWTMSSTNHSEGSVTMCMK